MKSAVGREAIALIFALKEFETSIRNHNSEVFLFTDASSLIYINKNKHVSSKFYSFALFVSSFRNVTVVHCSSQNMYLADLLTLSPPAFWYYVKHRGGKKRPAP